RPSAGASRDGRVAGFATRPLLFRELLAVKALEQLSPQPLAAQDHLKGFTHRAASTGRAGDVISNGHNVGTGVRRRNGQPAVQHERQVGYVVANEANLFGP